MDTKQREVLLKVLLDGSPRAPALVQMLTEDIDAMEPTLDDWLQQAEHRGRFQGILETLAARERGRDAKCAPGVGARVVCAVGGCQAEAFFIKNGNALCSDHRNAHVEHLPF